MKRNQALMGSLIVISTMVLSALAAQAVDVTPSNLQGWAPHDMRASGTAEINMDYPSNGDGSLNLTTTGTADKAGFAFDWNTTSSSTPFGVATRLSDLIEASYDWYRSSASTSAGNLAPSFQLSIYTDVNNDGPQASDFASLIFEPVYNSPPGNLPTDLWVSADAYVGNVWQFRQGGVGVIERYDLTISEWLDSGLVQPVGSLPIDGTTYVLGTRVVVGSGWAGITDAAADNVKLQFAGGDQYAANFAVPEPSTAVFGAMCAFFALMRRKRSAV